MENNSPAEHFGLVPSEEAPDKNGGAPSPEPQVVSNEYIIRKAEQPAGSDYPKPQPKNEAEQSYTINRQTQEPVATPEPKRKDIGYRIRTAEQVKTQQEQEMSPLERQEFVLEELKEVAQESGEVRKDNEELIEKTEEVGGSEGREMESEAEKLEEERQAAEREIEEALQKTEEVSKAAEDMEMKPEEVAEFKKQAMDEINQVCSSEFIQKLIQNGDEDVTKVMERIKAFNDLSNELKYEEIEKTASGYRTDLETAGVEDDESYSKKQEEILKELADDEKLKELQEKEDKFVKILQKEGVDINKLEGMDLENADAYLAGLGDKFQAYADFLKYEYLKSDLPEDKQLILSEHMDKLITIEKLEKTADLLHKGLGNLNEEEKVRIKKFAKEISLLIPALAILGLILAYLMEKALEKAAPAAMAGAKIAVGKIATIGGGILALYAYLKIEKQRDQFVEWLSGCKIQPWLRYKEKK